jgi:hypothetical protein
MREPSIGDPDARAADPQPRCASRRSAARRWAGLPGISGSGDRPGRPARPDFSVAILRNGGGGDAAVPFTDCRLHPIYGHASGS